MAPDTPYEEFSYLYRLGREAIEAIYPLEHYCIIDKKNISYFSCFPQANPELVYEAHCFGLLACVYPAKNLLEISRFPEELKKVIKQYRTKCVKSRDKEIYLKFQSTNPLWDEDYSMVQPFHLVQLGVAKEQIYSASEGLEAKLEKENLMELVIQKLCSIAAKVFNIKAEDNIKVNYATPYTLMTSYSHQSMSSEDYAKIEVFRDNFAKGRFFRFHVPPACGRIRKVIKKVGFDYLCPICPKEESLKEELESVIEYDETSSCQDIKNDRKK